MDLKDVLPKFRSNRSKRDFLYRKHDGLLREDPIQGSAALFQIEAPLYPVGPNTKRSSAAQGGEELHDVSTAYLSGD